MLGRIASFSFKKPWLVAVGWIVVVIAVSALSGALKPSFEAGMHIPASDSRDGSDMINKYFGDASSGRPGTIVFRAEQDVTDPEIQAAMTRMFDEAGSTIDGLTIQSPYEGPQGAIQINSDKTIAYASLNHDAHISQIEAGKISGKLLDMAPKIEGLDVEIGGSSFVEFEPPQSELIGVAFAILILILAFGSVLAMGMPIGVAIAGVSTGIGLVGLLSHVMEMPEFSTTIGAMIGLGVGIDYALFIVTRYREELHSGRDFHDAAVTANETAGRAVIFAGLTVVISLLGMLLIGLPFVSGLGVGSAVTVAVTMAASVTLLPALLGLAKNRIERTRWRGLVAAGLVSIALLGAGLHFDVLLVGLPLAAVVLIAGRFIPALNRETKPRVTPDPSTTLAYRWSRSVQRHPWWSLIVGCGILIALALPVFSLRLGFSDEGNFAKDTTTRKAYDMLADGFGPGFNGPLLVPVEVGNDAARASLTALTDGLNYADGVAQVLGPIPSDMKAPAESKAYLYRVIPDTSPQDEATEQLVHRLREQVIPEAVGSADLTVNVTGFVPIGLDFSEYLAARTLLFFGVVLALSFVLLMVVFRSLLVPIKAVIMNMLSIGAAYGVVVMVFQWGWAGSLTGLEPAPVEPFLPMMMFAIVFGLSMDYEVFLLSRVREEYFASGDPVGSVADGLAATARVITAAAAIMVVVFGAFVLEDQRVPKLFGLGLAVAVLLDATLVRMLLVPATMELLGARNWWLPRWLDRILPNVSVEGPSPVHPAETSPPAEAALPLTPEEA